MDLYITVYEHHYLLFRLWGLLVTMSYRSLSTPSATQVGGVLMKTVLIDAVMEPALVPATTSSLSARDQLELMLALCVISTKGNVKHAAPKIL